MIDSTDQLITEVLQQFDFADQVSSFKRFGSGHINSTWLVETGAGKYVLQSINQSVFKDPRVIARNIRLVGDYFAGRYPNYLFVGSVPARDGDDMPFIGGKFWRLSRYVDSSIAYDILSKPQQAYEAARQFGKLSRLLREFDASKLKPGIPGFHDINLRYNQFEEALQSASTERREQCADRIETVKAHRPIVDYYNRYRNSEDFPDRVMHHDTKISNMLFNAETDRGLCVVDLDTLMPGKFISDLGDMMRTYLCAYTEDEPDLSKIVIRTEYFEAIIRGYLTEMGPILTELEQEMILYSGKFLIYMQAVRFLTDFLNGDIYYPIAYPGHNLVRTDNQLKLLSEFFEKEQELQDIIDRCLLA